MKEVNISSGDLGQRLDKYLMKFFNKAPKSFVYKMLRKKRIKLNGKRAEGKEILAEGDTLQFYLADETINSMQEAKSVVVTKKEFEVVFEDENIIIVNKPVGLLVQPDSNEKNSLNDQMLFYLYQNGEYDTSKESSFKPGVSNRLDRNTSGIVTMGKNLVATKALNEAFKSDGIEKYYLTVVKGEVKKKGEIIAYHLKNEDNTVKIFDKPQGGATEIKTLYNPINIKNGYTLLEIQLITGKAHQIRASLQHLGYPVVGDRKYGDQMTNRLFRDKYKLDNQLLHAYKLVFNIVDGALGYLHKQEFVAEPKGVIKNIIDDLR